MNRRFRFFAFLIAALLLFSVCAHAESGAKVYTFDDQFTSRDLKQEADLTDAVTYTLTDGAEIAITEAGVYVIEGTARNATIRIEAGTDDKVQIVLNGMTVENEAFPVIYAKSADKVFVTTSADSALSVTGTFTTDGSVKTDGVIFAKCDLVLNGTASLSIASSDHGVVCKDDLKITGGTYRVFAKGKAIEANDSIRIADGDLTLEAGTDGLHAENDEDTSLGYVYIAGGSITISAGDDGIHGTSVVQIDGGTLNIRAA
ncbi:MAG: carbohydrate-binding domain-containing protein, partial [Clostridia bacterium]|nr:carbohydrate-binding domain-containing protein [Clostridia bacterium]